MIRIVAVACVVAVGVASSAHAVTSFEVTDNPGGQMLPMEVVSDGGTYGTTLFPFDSASISTDVTTPANAGSLFFTVLPSPFRATLDFTLSTADFLDFGATTATLTDGVTSVSGTVGAALEEVIISGEFISPIQVAFSWANTTTGSFNSDLSVAPIPLPAAGLMLLSGLGGLAALKRFRKA